VQLPLQHSAAFEQALLSDVHCADPQVPALHTNVQQSCGNVHELPEALQGVVGLTQMLDLVSQLAEQQFALLAQAVPTGPQPPVPPLPLAPAVPAAPPVDDPSAPPAPAVPPAPAPPVPVSPLPSRLASLASDDPASPPPAPPTPGLSVSDEPHPATATRAQQKATTFLATLFFTSSSMR
jgi:hypothetical protein